MIDNGEDKVGLSTLRKQIALKVLVRDATYGLQGGTCCIDGSRWQVDIEGGGNGSKVYVVHSVNAALLEFSATFCEQAGYGSGLDSTFSAVHHCLVTSQQ